MTFYLFLHCIFLCVCGLEKKKKPSIYFSSVFVLYSNPSPLRRFELNDMYDHKSAQGLSGLAGEKKKSAGISKY